MKLLNTIHTARQIVYVSVKVSTYFEQGALNMMVLWLSELQKNISPFITFPSRKKIKP